jgi:hypothetical protein
MRVKFLFSQFTLQKSDLGAEIWNPLIKSIHYFFPLINFVFSFLSSFFSGALNFTFALGQNSFFIKFCQNYFGVVVHSEL